MLSKSHFEDDRAQIYLVFQQIYKYFETLTNRHRITAWKSKGMSEENITPPGTQNEPY